MKIGLYASMFGKDDPPTLQSIESYTAHAYDLQLPADARAALGQARQTYRASLT